MTTSPPRSPIRRPLSQSWAWRTETFCALRSGWMRTRRMRDAVCYEARCPPELTVLSTHLFAQARLWRRRPGRDRLRRLPLDVGGDDELSQVRPLLDVLPTLIPQTDFCPTLSFEEEGDAELLLVGAATRHAAPSTYATPVPPYVLKRTAGLSVDPWSPALTSVDALSGQRCSSFATVTSHPFQ
jgi:hypothetical protein